MYEKALIRPFGTLVFILFSCSSQAQAAVSPEPIEITQPNGSSLSIVGVGTADNSYTETIDGYTLLRNKKGIYVYAQIDKCQNLIPSKLKAHNPNNRPKRELKCLDKNFKPHLR